MLDILGVDAVGRSYPATRLLRRYGGCHMSQQNFGRPDGRIHPKIQEFLSRIEPVDIILFGALARLPLHKRLLLIIIEFHNGMFGDRSRSCSD